MTRAVVVIENHYVLMDGKFNEVKNPEISNEIDTA